VTNKVGSPQLVGWLAPPVVAALTLVPAGVARRRWTAVGAGVLGIAALTQVVFPFGSELVVSGDPLLTTVLAVRNAGLVAVLVVALVTLRRLTRAAA
jgi:hypothetical protein